MHVNKVCRYINWIQLINLHARCGCCNDAACRASQIFSDILHWHILQSYRTWVWMSLACRLTGCTAGRWDQFVFAFALGSFLAGLGRVRQSPMICSTRYQVFYLPTCSRDFSETTKFEDISSIILNILLWCSIWWVKMARHQTTVASSLRFHWANHALTQMSFAVDSCCYDHLEFWSKNRLLGRRFSSRWWSLISSWNCWDLQISPANMANQKKMCWIAKTPDCVIMFNQSLHFRSF